MNERFLIPTAVAAVLHAVLFFGFNPGRIPMLPKDPTARPTTPPDTVKVEWTPVSEDPEASPEPGSASSAPLPVLPEPPVTTTDTFTQIPITRETPQVTSLPTSTIPTNLGPSDTGRIGVPGPRLVSSAGLDNPPRTRAQLSPVYPAEARRNGRAGEVTVEFVVDEAGHVLDPHVLRSNDPIFDEPTLRAVAKWRFEPGRKNGRVVRFRMAVPVAYAVNP